MPVKSVYEYSYLKLKTHSSLCALFFFSVPTGGIKRKGPSKPGLPARKKPKKKTEPLDEDTLVALALSSSLLEQDEEHKRDKETELQLQAETAVCHTSMTSVLKRRPDQGTVTPLQYTVLS